MLILGEKKKSKYVPTYKLPFSSSLNLSVLPTFKASECEKRLPNIGTACRQRSVHT